MTNMGSIRVFTSSSFTLRPDYNKLTILSSCRRKLAVADSRKRMSLVVLNEVINNFIKSELVSVAKDAKRFVN